MRPPYPLSEVITPDRKAYSAKSEADNTIEAQQKSAANDRSHQLHFVSVSQSQTAPDPTLTTPHPILQFSTDKPTTKVALTSNSHLPQHPCAHAHPPKPTAQIAANTTTKPIHCATFNHEEISSPQSPLLPLHSDHSTPTSPITLIKDLRTNSALIRDELPHDEYCFKGGGSGKNTA